MAEVGEHGELIPEAEAFASAKAKAAEWGAPAPLGRLTLTYDVCETSENIERNIRATLETKYQTFNALIAPPTETEVSVCGFGPSLKDTYTKLRGDVWACNGAHDWLIERGVIPKFGMYWDAYPLMTQYLKPHKDVTYLVASRCHRNVFEALEGYNVYVWHAGGDECIERLLCEYKRMEPMLAGGSSAVTRAMTVATCMGYRKINMFGSDGSYTGETTHLNKSIVEEKPLEVWCDGRKFLTTSWMAAQAEDFKILGPALRSQGCTIEFYGDGLTPHVARINGFAVHNSTT